MRTEIPVCKRCCFCLPLRYGLILWGNLRLGISIALLVMLGFLWHAVFTKSYFVTHDRVYTGIATLIAISDFVLSLIFIVGCLKKNVILMKIFYFYSQLLLGLTTAWIIYLIGDLITNFFRFTQLEYRPLREDELLSYGMYVVVKCIAFLAHLFLQSYMLLLVRSEIMKLNNGCEFRFVNHADEAQCTLDVTLPTQSLPHENDTEAC